MKQEHRTQKFILHHLSKNNKVELHSEVTIAKDESGSHAVFNELGSLASQMTIDKVMDLISRLPGCAGQAVDAKSAHAQVKMENATNF